MSKRARGKMLKIDGQSPVFSGICHHCELATSNVLTKPDYKTVSEKDFCQHLKTRLRRLSNEHQA